MWKGLFASLISGQAFLLNVRDKIPPGNCWHITDSKVYDTELLSIKDVLKLIKCGFFLIHIMSE